jgi:hypothetical protein
MMFLLIYNMIAWRSLLMEHYAFIIWDHVYKLVDMIIIFKIHIFIICMLEDEHRISLEIGYM